MTDEDQPEPMEVRIDSDPPGLDSPFDRLGQDPEDLYSYAFFGFAATPIGQPMLVWDMQSAVPASLQLEMAEHLERYAEHIREGYWRQLASAGEAPAGLEPGEDRAYE